uniref:uncharacterized protein LOC122608560 n=1 Tax=Erigeron canadensis TaxID=72917 RepID=UPI001CB8D50B|nr:uncharacterized protein LOC122608560 [Erigeron canadensis]
MHNYTKILNFNFYCSTAFFQVAGHTCCLRCSQPIQYEALDSQVWSTVHGTSVENVAKNTAIANSGVMNTDRRSILQERIEPCPLSSSIYYGGQEDMYIHASKDLTSKLYTKFSVEQDSKEGEESNHLQGATRGNWWQGSLYY